MRNKQIHKSSFMKMLVLSLAVFMLVLSLPMAASAEATVLTANTTAGSSMDFDTSAFSSMTVGQTAVISYDIKFSGLSNLLQTSIDDSIRLSGGTYNSRHLISVYNGQFGQFDDMAGGYTETVSITENAWYSVVVSVTKRANGDNFAEFREVSIYDTNGVFVIGNSRLKDGTGTNGWVDAQVAYSLSVPKTSSGTATVTVDNISTAVYTLGAAPTISSMNIENGAEGVALNPTFTLVFDRLVTGAPVLKNGNDTVTTVTKAVGNTVTVSMPTDTLLSKGTTYTLEFSGITNTEETPLACTAESISFTTEYASLFNDVTVTAAAGSGTVTASFTLSHPNGYPSFTGYIAAALYDDGILKAIDVLPSETVSTGVSLGKTFALTAESGDTLQLMLFDVTRGVAPVTSGECAVTVAP